jgi:hypothetical protein
MSALLGAHLAPLPALDGKTFELDRSEWHLDASE